MSTTADAAPESSGVSHLKASIRILSYPTGRRAAILRVGDAPPCPWVAKYLLDLTRSSLVIRTVRNRALGVARLIAFCCARGIDYVARCTGAMLTDSELVDLAAYMRGDPRSPRTTAGPDYAAATDFLRVTAERMRRADDGDARLLIRAFVSDAERHKPASSRHRIKPRRGFTEPQREVFLRAIIPGPASGSMGFRDYVILLTAYNLGLRTGELLGLKMEDLKLRSWPGSLEVVKRIDDPDEKRILPAKAKTVGRLLPLGPKLTTAYIEIKKHRGRVDHPYVFVNCDGGPLGERGLRGIYEKMRERYPDLEGLINHMLRHDWNDRWNRMQAKPGGNPDKGKREQRHAMGWSADSQMPLLYGQRSLEEDASARCLAMQDEDLRRLGKGKP